MLAEADTVQDLIAALSAANGAPASVRVQTETAALPTSSSLDGLAEGVPAAQTFRKCCGIAGAWTPRELT